MFFITIGVHSFRFVARYLNLFPSKGYKIENLQPRGEGGLAFIDFKKNVRLFIENIISYSI